MKTKTCKLYSRVFWTPKPNVIKIDPDTYTVSKLVQFLRHSVRNLAKFWRELNSEEEKTDFCYNQIWSQFSAHTYEQFLHVY